jgi:hypothetical protein
MPASWTQLHDEAVEIVTGAERDGVTLRVVGSTGIRLHCSAAADAMQACGRVVRDIDLIVPAKQRKGMRRFLEARGYVIDRDLLIAMEGRRYSFTNPATDIDLDVFVEQLEFNHTVDVRKRPGRHNITVALEDLLLAKLQIVNLTPTDLVDLTVLLTSHPVTTSDGGEEAIDAAYVAKCLAADWGFHHTAVRSLVRLRDALDGGDVPAVPAVVAGGPDNPAGTVRERVGILEKAIETAPKSMAWRVRGRLGERVQWWEDVDEREATY